MSIYIYPKSIQYIFLFIMITLKHDTEVTCTIAYIYIDNILGYIVIPRSRESCFVVYCICRYIYSYPKV